MAWRNNRSSSEARAKVSMGIASSAIARGAIPLVAAGAIGGVAATSSADFLGIQAEIDLLALDGVTTLASLGYEDLTVFNVYAVFDDPGDRAVAVTGSSEFPFNVFTCNSSGFTNAPAGDDRPPSAAAAGALPALNIDSFFTLGNRLLDVGPAYPSGAPFEDLVIVAPGTPGPDEDPWGEGHDNMGWLARPQVDDPGSGAEVAPPQTLAGNWPGNRVLLMRLTVSDGTDVFGSFGITYIDGGGPDIAGVTFSATGGGEFGACCLSPTRCVGCTTPVSCNALGGDFLGFGSECQTQEIEEEIVEQGGEIFVHVITVPVDCTKDGGGAGPCEAGPMIDPWISPPNALMCQAFGVPGSPAIPAGFFFPGSDPISGSVCLEGAPLGPIEIAGAGIVDFGEVDTLIMRSADPFDGCELPEVYPVGPVEVDIHVEALKMQGVGPIIVTNGGGQNPHPWTVSVGRSSVYTDGDPGNDPPPGTLRALRTHNNGGTYTSVLPVQARFIFRKVGDPTQVRILDTGLEGLPPVFLDASETPLPWVHEVNEGLSGPSPFCTHFHPGISGLDPAVVDCNGNGIRDDCDIRDGVSGDCNGNGIPDACDSPPPACACPADLDRSGAVDVDDLVQLILSWGPCPGGCAADIVESGEVDVEDLIVLVTSWGPCG